VDGQDTVLFAQFGLNDWTTKWTRECGIYQTALVEVCLGE
jgi:hypothetical protein